MSIKQSLQKHIESQLKTKITLEIPPTQDLGDYSLHSYKLKLPPDILQKRLKLPKYIEKTEIKGPYLNFFINKTKLAEITIKKILKEKDKYGSNNEGKHKKALVEHTSINPNASPHMGRARNAIIGDSIVKILRFQGYKTETHYYVNDIGKQIAMLVLASDGKKPQFNQLLNLYAKFNKELENNKKLEEKIFELLNKLEKKDKKTIKKFKDIVAVCIKGQAKILSELNIRYNLFDYESLFLFNKDTEKILKQLKDTGKLFKDNENRIAADLSGFSLPMENPYLPLTRSDGTSMYLLRDIAYSIYKEKRAKHRNIILLGEDQKLYFLQLKSLLSLIKHKSPEVIHYSFVLLPSGKMSTRKGEVVLLEEFMKEIKEKASEEIIKRHKKDNEKLSKTIGYGALKFTILKVSPDKNITFETEKALSFEGESGPYVQYAYTRANSILRKLKNLKKPKFNAITSIYEHALIKKLSEFQEVVGLASANLHPHLIANYSLELAKIFNEFYHNCHVIQEKEPIKSTRAAIVRATRQTLKNSLALLGMECPEIM